MPRERTPEEAYDDLVSQGMYEESHRDDDEIQKIVRLCIEDYHYGKRLRETKDPNWRVIYNIHYDVIRELCDQLMRFKNQKVSNHQGLFAFIVLKFEEFEKEWDFFELLRGIRNNNKYRGTDITKETWKNVEIKIDLCIAALKKEIEKRMQEK